MGSLRQRTDVDDVRLEDCRLVRLRSCSIVRTRPLRLHPGGAFRLVHIKSDRSTIRLRTIFLFTPGSGSGSAIQLQVLGRRESVKE